MSSVSQASAAGLARKAGAEAIGTFALVFAGCGAMVVDQLTGGTIGHVGIAMTFGLVVLVMVYATGHISGAHFNPAVSIAFAVVGRFPWREVPAYIASQVAAAMVAAGLLFVIFGDATNLGATQPMGSLSQSLVLEIVLTAFLMFVIMSVATDARATGQAAGLAIGSTVALASLFGGPISGSSMNPARTLGPGLVSGELSHVWLYLVGPLVGAVIGVFAYQTVRCSDTESRKTGDSRKPDESQKDGAKGCC